MGAMARQRRDGLRAWRALATTCVLLVAVALAACGGSEASSSASSSPSPTSPGLVSRLATLSGYLSQVKPIASQVGDTVAALPGAVKGLSSKPNASWTAAASKLDTIAKQLGNEADDLSILSPPTGFGSAQATTVSGIRKAQSAVQQAADKLAEGKSTASLTKANVASAVKQLQAYLSQVTGELVAGIQGALASPQATPAP